MCFLTPTGHLRICLIFLLATLPSLTWAGSSRVSLDRWMQDTLIPSIGEQLDSHPRFRNEVLRFVVLQNGNPAPMSNELALAIRDRLQQAMIDRTAIKVAWQVDRQSLNRTAESSRVDCTASRADYYVGIEVTDGRADRHSVAVRILDVEQQEWVSGIGANWHGTLSTKQRRAYRSPEADSAWLGQRVAPFDETQVDLLAAQLAFDLGCSLLREMSGEYVAIATQAEDNPVADMLKLVSNNLAPYQALQISNDDAGNSSITTSAHRVDADLYQYWVTVTPNDPNSDMPSLAASAYIYLSEQYLPATLAHVDQASGMTSNAAVLDSLQVVRLPYAAGCPAFGQRIYDRASANSDQCYALQAITEQDAVLFFLYHQLNNGLVRLADGDCSGTMRARISRRHEPLRFPLSIDVSSNPQWLPGDDWKVNPDTDTFYVVGTTNSRAGRAIAKHMEQLPVRCGRSLRPGMEGAALRRWFRELDGIADHWQRDVDWKSVRVKEIY